MAGVRVVSSGQMAKFKYFYKFKFNMKKNKHAIKEEVLLKVQELFDKAKFSNNPNDHVRKARRIAMKVNLHLPKDIKRKFCKHCNNYFKSGNYRVRTRNKTVVYYCLNCKKFSKFIIKAKRPN